MTHASKGCESERAGRESTDTLVHLYRRHIGWCRVHFMNPTSTGIKYAGGCADAFAYKYFDERRYRFERREFLHHTRVTPFFPRYFSDFSRKFDIRRTLRIRLRAFFCNSLMLRITRSEIHINKNLCDFVDSLLCVNYIIHKKILKLQIQ